MSVHELKRSPIKDITEWQVDVPNTQALLRHWAQVSPLQPALRHKRHGQWLVWRWIDVLRDVERLVDGLSQQGFTDASRLVLSGAFGPDLLLLALAAQHIAGQVLTLPDNLAHESLHDALARIRPSHAFVQGRHCQQRWINQGQTPLDFNDLLGPAEPPQRLIGWWHGPQLWSEEGTQWQAGLSVLLDQWLNSGQSLAFPQSPASARRDRREVAPTGLLLSQARLECLVNEIDRRLAAPGTWRRRLCDWAIAHPKKGPQRLIKLCVRRLFGFQNLHFIWPVTRHLCTQPRADWLFELKRDTA